MPCSVFFLPHLFLRVSLMTCSSSQEKGSCPILCLRRGLMPYSSSSRRFSSLLLKLICFDFLLMGVPPNPSSFSLFPYQSGSPITRSCSSLLCLIYLSSSSSLLDSLIHYSYQPFYFSPSCGASDCPLGAIFRPPFFYKSPWNP